MYLIILSKKSKNLQNKRIDLGEIVKEFDITNPSDIKFSTGKELIGGIVNAFSGLLETAYLIDLVLTLDIVNPCIWEDI